jgi:hypothetical protein
MYTMKAPSKWWNLAETYKVNQIFYERDLKHAVPYQSIKLIHDVHEGHISQQTQYFVHSSQCQNNYILQLHSCFTNTVSFKQNQNTS